MVDLLGSNLAKVLMLLGVVVIGGIFIAASGSDKVGAQISDIQQLMAVAQARLGATPNGYTNFTTANAAALISSGVVPSGMAKTGNALRDRWGGAVALGNANNAAQGTITFGGNEDTTACSGLAMGLSGYQTMSVGGQVFSRNNPPDAVTANAGCAAGGIFVITFG